MKTTSAFKLSKSVKRMLAVTDNKQRKADFKSLMITAEVEHEHNKRISGKRREKSEE